MLFIGSVYLYSCSTPDCGCLHSAISEWSVSHQCHLVSGNGRYSQMQSMGNDELCCFIPTLELHVCIAEENYVNCTSGNCKRALLQPRWNVSTAWECWRLLASRTNPLSSNTFGGVLHFRIRPQLSNSLCASDQSQFLFVSISEIVSASESASVSTSGCIHPFHLPAVIL